MIIVCEPQCKKNSHEEVNSGFIYGLHLAYSKEKILFFVDSSHFQEVKMILNNKIPVQLFRHQTINFDTNKTYSIAGIIKYYLLMRKVFDAALTLKQNKIFFLSNNPVILFTIKLLKQRNKYRNICCTFVLHGELEDIANAKYNEPYVSVVKHRPSLAKLEGVVARLVKNRKNIPSFIKYKIISLLRRPFVLISSKYFLIFKRIFREKQMLMWRHTDQYKYISLSPHVTKNAGKYLDTKYLNFYTIYLPIVFHKPLPAAKNEYIKFAVFGYGDSGRMYEMLLLFSKKKITKTYEIKIVSMDDRGTEGFRHITRIGHGKVLARRVMENSIKDVDVFINLYHKTRYRFGCSLSIFEALSYLKPVLYTSNPGYDYFNKTQRPIGIRTENLNEFVEKMCDMIENYDRYKNRLRTLRNNMLEYRRIYSIQNNLGDLRKSFTFE